MSQFSGGPGAGATTGTLPATARPERLETPFDTMEYVDGLPTPDTVGPSFDALDLVRAIEAFLDCLPGASTVAVRRALRQLVGDSTTIAYTDPRLTSAPRVLTGNTETTYGMTFLALDRDGPTVIEVPENSLSILNDLWQRYVADLGIAGPDAGAGGRYLILPPDHDGDVPDGYFVVRSATFSCWAVFRTLGGVEALRRTRVYPLSDAADPPGQRFVDFADSQVDARAAYHYAAVLVSPALAKAAVGVGSQYAYTAEDATGAWLDGARNYTLRRDSGPLRSGRAAGPGGKLDTHRPGQGVPRPPAALRPAAELVRPDLAARRARAGVR